ncbi:MAG: hypothetical protein ACK4K7_07305 [Allosphingosinicella sp.]|uniref:hypothetical protein n=1 Tax=Allosphingosinicella sp. TaxID=2823234 RepID=UPI0039575044
MRPTAATALTRALARGFAALGEGYRLERIDSRPWASVTFSGARHRLVLRLAGAGAEQAADRFLDGLEEREFQLPGHYVADIARVSDARAGGVVRIEIEALTVEAD